MVQPPSRPHMQISKPSWSRHNPILTAVTIPKDRPKAKLISVCHYTSTCQSSARGQDIITWCGHVQAQVGPGDEI